jgi:hypothetical protein
LGISFTVLEGKVAGEGGVEATVAVSNVEAGADNGSNGNTVARVRIKLSTEVECGSHGAIANLNVGGECGGNLLCLRIEVQAEIGPHTDPIIAGEKVVGSKGTNTKSCYTSKLRAGVVEVDGRSTGEKSGGLGVWKCGWPLFFGTIVR